jgi:hypothetical protein
VFLFDLFHSLLPLHNPIGFGAADFIEFALAAILVALFVSWRRIAGWGEWLAARPRCSMALLAALPVALRLALLPHYPVPTPSGADDFSYLLLADTLRHFRFANAVHAMHRFFEAVFVLQEPSYSSIFPPGQGFVLIFGWAGVLLTAAAFCALCYWMLRGWTQPKWALLGGLLAVIQFGPLCGWMNDYWGGLLSACAGCLMFGSLPRLRLSFHPRDGALLGIGIALQWLTRPFECLLACIAVAVFLLPANWRKLRQPLLAASVPLVLALGLTAIQDRQVTGNWLTMPYMLSRYQYGVPAAFTTQPNPIPHRTLTPEQQLDYEAQTAVHGPGTGSFRAYWQRLASRIGFYRFFFLVPLFIAPLGLFRDRRFFWLAAAILIFALGANFYPYFYPHYIAAETCLFLLVSVAGLAGLGSGIARIAAILCFTHAIFWYCLHLAGSENQRIALTRFENWDFINLGDPGQRIAVNRQLDRLPGQLLVFVRYGPAHGFHEWVHNAADIDSSRIVWAGDLGDAANRALIAYYPHRTPLLVEPDAHPARLTRYHPNEE